MSSGDCARHHCLPCPCPAAQSRAHSTAHLTRPVSGNHQRERRIKKSLLKLMRLLIIHQPSCLLPIHPSQRIILSKLSPIHRTIEIEHWALGNFIPSSFPNFQPWSNCLCHTHTLPAAHLSCYNQEHHHSAPPQARSRPRPRPLSQAKIWTYLSVSVCTWNIYITVYLW
jgi:hypothetical protein